MKNHAETARENFVKGYNCAQAVFIAFKDEMGLDEVTAARLSSSFGAGMGKMREVCGAVSGALMVLGMLKGNFDPADDKAKSDHYGRVQEFAAKFKEEHETVICRDLLKGLALKKEYTHEPEKRTEEYYKVRPCVRFVETAAKILDEMLAE